MQDWISDTPLNFGKTLKTATQLHAEEFAACRTCEQQPWFSFFFDGIGMISCHQRDELLMNEMTGGCT